MSLRLLTPAVLCLAVAGSALADDAANAPRVTGIDTTAMDRAVRPQDDLFRHVNGTWLANTPFPAEYASAGVGIMLFEKAQADVQAILLEAAAAGDKASPEMQRLGAMYSSFPLSVPVLVSSVRRSLAFATPKSMSFVVPRTVTRMFCGETSRWTTSRYCPSGPRSSWTAWRPAHASAHTRSATPIGKIIPCMRTSR